MKWTIVCLIVVVVALVAVNADEGTNACVTAMKECHSNCSGLKGQEKGQCHKACGEAKRNCQGEKGGKAGDTATTASA